MEDRYLDVIKAVTEGRTKLLLNSNLNGKFFRKKLIIKDALKNKKDIAKILEYIVPERFNSKTTDAKHYYADVILNNFFKDYPLNPVKLFEYVFYYYSSENSNKRKEYLDFMDLISCIKGVILEDQYSIKKFTKNSSIIIDAGANLGIFSFFAHHLNKESKIYAFEPTKKIFDLLSKNVKNNNLQDNIYPQNFALGDKKGAAEIVINNEESFGSLGMGGNVVSDSGLMKNKAVGGTQKETIQMTTIDDFVEKNNLKKVDFIKIDTEGYEKQVIKGAENTINQFSPTISCSAYHLVDDKIKIPELIMSMNHNYKYSLQNNLEEDLIFWV